MYPFMDRIFISNGFFLWDVSTSLLRYSIKTVAFSLFAEVGVKSLAYFTQMLMVLWLSVMIHNLVGQYRSDLGFVRFVLLWLQNLIHGVSIRARLNIHVIDLLYCISLSVQEIQFDLQCNKYYDIIGHFIVVSKK